MNTAELKKIIDESEHILVIQAENPDGDSLSSSLALEEILSEMGKKVSMYCAVNIPNHLRHLSGWDRVVTDMPTNFDASIIVDTSTMSLLEKAFAEGQLALVKSKPLIVIDHHDTEPDIDFASLIINDTDSVATGEVIYQIGGELGWELTLPACEFLASSIMYDSLGLVSEGATPRSIRVVADLVEEGVSLAKLDNLRRQSMVKSKEITNYKGRLLQRYELLVDGQLAYIHIPWEEIQEFSDQYNPSMLVLDDMRLTEGVKLAVSIKSYPDGRITGKLRTNFAVPVAATIAERFGGGGHPYAAGFKTKDLTLEEVRTKLQQYTKEALDEAI